MEADTNGKPAAGPKNVRFLPPSYALKEKAPLTDIDLASVVADARTVLKGLQEEYLTILDQERKALSAACCEVERTLGAGPAVALLRRRAQEIRGHSGSVGLEAICRICDSLSLFLLEHETLPGQGITIARLHVDAIDAVMRDPKACSHVTGKCFEAVFGELQKVIRKFDKAHA